MTTLWVTIVGLLVAYLLGAIPFGVLLGRWRGVDIRLAGSGNTGATNAARLLGWRLGLLVFLLDVSKGFVPTLFAGFMLHEGKYVPDLPLSSINMIWVLVGLSCVAGHMSSPFLGFRGGKGVATSLGVAMAIFPDLTYPGLACLGIWLICLLATRIVSVASMLSAVAFPILFAAFAYGSHRDIASRWPLAGFALLVAMVVVWRHRPNISRLIAGSEPHFALSVKKNT